MRWALTAAITVVSLGTAAYLLMQEERSVPCAGTDDASLAAINAHDAAGGISVNASEAPEWSGEPSLIKAVPFRRETDRQEKLLVRVIEGPVGEERTVPAAEIRFQTGKTRPLGAEVLEDREVTRRTLSNRWGEARFDLPRSGAWWVEVSKGGRRVSLRGTVDEVQSGLLVVRFVPPSALRVKLEGVTQRVEVEAGWLPLGEQEFRSSVTTEAKVGDAREYARVMPSMSTFTAGPDEPVLLNVDEGHRLRVEVKSVAGAFAGWVEVPPLTAGETRDITLVVKQGCVVTAKLPADWPAEAGVEACCVRVESHGWYTMEQQKCKASDELRFLLPESARYAIMATRRGPDSVSCAFKALDVAAGGGDAGVLDAGPASAKVHLSMAPDLLVPADAVLLLRMNASIHNGGDFGGWSQEHAFRPGSLNDFQIHGLPTGFVLEASLWNSSFQRLRQQNQEVAERKDRLRGASGSAATKSNGTESEDERSMRFEQQCEWPRQRVMLKAGSNTLALALKLKAEQRRASHLALFIAPPPAQAWRDDGYVVKFRTEDSNGASGSSRQEGVWRHWFSAGIEKVDVLILCGDHVLGPRTIRLNPNAETEVHVDEWQSRDDAAVSAAVDRFAPLLRARSPRSGR